MDDRHHFPQDPTVPINLLICVFARGLEYCTVKKVLNSSSPYSGLLWKRQYVEEGLLQLLFLPK